MHEQRECTQCGGRGTSHGHVCVNCGGRGWKIEHIRERSSNTSNTSDKPLPIIVAVFVIIGTLLTACIAAYGGWKEAGIGGAIAYALGYGLFAFIYAAISGAFLYYAFRWVIKLAPLLIIISVIVVF